MAVMGTDRGVDEWDAGSFGQVHRNLPVAALVEHAIRRGEGRLAANGAISATTGKRTGRSPGDKFIVRNAITDSTVDWGRVNQPMDQERYDQLRMRLLDHLRNEEVYLLDSFAGADRANRLPIQVITEYAWHSLFARQLFRDATPADLDGHVPAYTVIAAPRFAAVPERDGTNSETVVAIDFERGEILIGGTEYAGEIKKSIFSVLNFLLPQQGIFPMHCSANTGRDGDVALFFGLSGTGKTSLSSDPARRLIGDDEHGWGDTGVFNFEGGCYAKCIRLRREAEPQIFDAIRFGSVMENVVLDPATHEPRYDDDSLTENTRVAYPLDYIANTVADGTGGHPRAIFFLTADAFGVLPPIARLSPEQAMYHFLSGYTAKLAGTEVGMAKDPSATFEACFGSPFLPLPAVSYAEMLKEKLEQHGTRVYLLNTGWSGGPFGIGSRIDIGYTRAMVRAALNGALDQVEMYVDDHFGLHVPVRIPGAPEQLMRPRDTWDDPEEYERLAQQLAGRFVENFRKFGPAAASMAHAGPRVEG
ncbi:MAG TPA: phosphoenolpyruvate carboxykinase (ATP) [Herpetosiphonaceae bacterium]|nr:phosphoenolpyruvate carboxykinase (ATP) [Herpetosiphonaceae bacterium]